MYNVDGSKAEMCGNALRCVSKYLFDRKIADKQQQKIMTGAGILTADILKVKDGNAEEIRLFMGAPIQKGTDIPTVWSGILVMERNTEDHCRCSRDHQAHASGTGIAAQDPRIRPGSVCIFPNHPRSVDNAHGGKYL